MFHGIKVYTVGVSSEVFIVAYSVLRESSPPDTSLALAGPRKSLFGFRAASNQIKS